MVRRRATVEEEIQRGLRQVVAEEDSAAPDRSAIAGGATGPTVGDSKVGTAARAACTSLARAVAQSRGGDAQVVVNVGDINSLDRAAVATGATVAVADGHGVRVPCGRVDAEIDGARAARAAGGRAVGDVIVSQNSVLGRGSSEGECAASSQAAIAACPIDAGIGTVEAEKPAWPARAASTTGDAVGGKVAAGDSDGLGALAGGNSAAISLGTCSTIAAIAGGFHADVYDKRDRSNRVNALV